MPVPDVFLNYLILFYIDFSIVHWLLVSCPLINVGIFFNCAFPCVCRRPILLSLVFGIRILSAKVDWKWLLIGKLDGKRSE